MKIIKNIFSHISPLWMMPLLAVGIVIWLIFRGYINSGMEIVIEFKAGDKILAGKTTVEYKGIEVGKVIAVDISAQKTDSIIVTAKLKKGAEILAKEGTTFWIVKPKVTLNEISGLETILSGVYIEVRPSSFATLEDLGKKKTQTHFQGLTLAPQEKSEVQGAKFDFYASKKGSLEAGSGIYFRDIKIGQILETNLTQDNSQIKFSAVIYDEYKKLIEFPFYLWRQGVLDIKFNPKEISFQTANFKSFIEGRMEFGIFSFDSSLKKKRSKILLYNSEVEAQKEHIRTLGGKEITLAVLDHHKISEGSPIYYKNTIVGELGHFNLDAENDTNTISGYIFPQYIKLVKDESTFWPITDILASFEKMNLKVNMPLVKQFVTGGVEFENISHFINKQPSGLYNLYPSHQDALTATEKSKPVLKLILKARERKSLEENSPVTYRQIQVGRISFVRLSSSSKEVEVGIEIEMQYAHLIRKETRFWVTSGFRAKLGLSGLKVETDSMKAIMNGGVALATPTENYGPPAKNDDKFKLYDEADKEWLEWSPQL